MVPKSPYYLVSADGVLRFTSTGKARLRERFQIAGICMDDIRTYSDFVQAQRQASPHFGDWLTNVALDLPTQGQYALLREALLSDVMPADSQSSPSNSSP